MSLSFKFSIIYDVPATQDMMFNHTFKFGIISYKPCKFEMIHDSSPPPEVLSIKQTEKLLNAISPDVFTLSFIECLHQYYIQYIV